MPSSNSKVLWEMALFFQWLWWRTEDPMGDAMRGRHLDRPSCDYMKALGSLRMQLRVILGDRALEEHSHDWFYNLIDTHFENLPEPPRRLTAKRPSTTSRVVEE